MTDSCVCILPDSTDISMSVACTCVPSVQVMVVHLCYVPGGHAYNLSARAHCADMWGYMAATCLAVWHLGLQWAYV